MKAKIIKITPEMIGSLCKSTGDNCLLLSIKGIPEDSKFIFAFFNNEERIFNCIFEHESFKDIDIGIKLPVINVIHTKYYL